MNANRLTYLFNNGKNAKFPYYLKAFSRLAIPSSWLHQRLQRLLDEKADPTGKRYTNAQNIITN